MDPLDKLLTDDPLLKEEVAALSPEHQRCFTQNLRRRQKAVRLAARLQLDVDDVYHQLKQLERSIEVKIVGASPLLIS